MGLERGEAAGGVAEGFGFDAGVVEEGEIEIRQRGFLRVAEVAAHF